MLSEFENGLFVGATASMIILGGLWIFIEVILNV